MAVGRCSNILYPKLFRAPANGDYVSLATSRLCTRLGNNANSGGAWHAFINAGRSAKEAGLSKISGPIIARIMLAPCDERRNHVTSHNDRGNLRILIVPSCLLRGVHGQITF